eukprot:gnl/Chilomastix_caulleri/5797.p2 GENE.gnl/Chilomastix_caulleri/5797~~gnl/Chilomastix_caulleri/5797.p2  ORF type:complete len:88 (-),score=20.63 gnl/Chilomastix_caulleri/5797:205-468(-)
MNSPSAFQQESKFKNSTSTMDEEKRRKISVRKFQCGAVGDSFNILKNAPSNHITPTEEEIKTLFPPRSQSSPAFSYPTEVKKIIIQQ